MPFIPTVPPDHYNKMQTPKKAIPLPQEEKKEKENSLDMQEIDMDAWRVEPKNVFKIMCNTEATIDERTGQLLPTR